MNDTLNTYITLNLLKHKLADFKRNLDSNIENGVSLDNAPTMPEIDLLIAQLAGREITGCDGVRYEILGELIEPELREILVHGFEEDFWDSPFLSLLRSYLKDGRDSDAFHRDLDRLKRFASGDPDWNRIRPNPVKLVS